MEKLNIEYLQTRSDILLNMEDDEFAEWLNCDDCILDDYHVLIDVLEREEMYERIITTQDFVSLLGQNIHRM